MGSVAVPAAASDGADTVRCPGPADSNVTRPGATPDAELLAWIAPAESSQVTTCSWYVVAGFLPPDRLTCRSRKSVAAGLMTLHSVVLVLLAAGWPRSDAYRKAGHLGSAARSF